MSHLCLTCRFANWRKTSGGKLHPSGDGRCTWKMPEIKLPASMYFISHSPNPSGGFIYRKERIVTECPTHEEDAS